MAEATASAREQRIPREVIKRAFREAGMSAQEADEVVDLAIHATTGAMDLLFEVTGRASQPSIKLSALSTAAGMLDAQLKLFKQGLAEAEKRLGVKGISVAVEVPARG